MEKIFLMVDISEKVRQKALVPQVDTKKIGILILNLGTPEGTDYWSIRAYLKEFLSDRRVIEMPRLLWWFILNGIILTKRPFAKGKDYASIWNMEKNESPLKTVTRSQAEKLHNVLNSTFPDQIIVDWAMRYGKPAISEKLNILSEQGCERILLLPLYPQYSAATSATACDHAFKALQSMRWQPSIRIVPPYYDDPVYIDALADSIRKNLDNLDFEPEILLISFHGVPQSYILQGDPYDRHCLTTFYLLQEKLERSDAAMKMTYQSRFGKQVWLQPYTSDTIKDLAQKGIKRIAVAAPGFSADCLETLEELDKENRKYFLDNGGEKFAYLPALNDSDEGMKVITSLVLRELQGWLPSREFC